MVLPFHHLGQAVSGETGVRQIVVGTMERDRKINGVIPDPPLASVDQRSVHLDGGEATFSIEVASVNMPKMMGDGKMDTAGNVDITR